MWSKCNLHVGGTWIIGDKVSDYGKQIWSPTSWCSHTWVTSIKCWKDFWLASKPRKCERYFSISLIIIGHSIRLSLASWLAIYIPCWLGRSKSPHCEVVYEEGLVARNYECMSGRPPTKTQKEALCFKEMNFINNQSEFGCGPIASKFLLTFRWELSSDRHFGYLGGDTAKTCQNSWPTGTKR